VSNCDAIWPNLNARIGKGEGKKVHPGRDQTIRKNTNRQEKAGSKKITGQTKSKKWGHKKKAGRGSSEAEMTKREKGAAGQGKKSEEKKGPKRKKTVTLVGDGHPIGKSYKGGYPGRKGGSLKKRNQA